jgi:hypothetical protein
MQLSIKQQLLHQNDEVGQIWIIQKGISDCDSKNDQELLTNTSAPQHIKNISIAAINTSTHTSTFSVLMSM